MSFPTWNGGKDKGAFRTLSDVAGGTDGIRTVTQTQGDTTTTLRTRAGNPEMTIRKKGGPRVVLEEVKYSARKYWRDKDENQDQKFDDEMQEKPFHNDKTVSRFFFVLKKILFSVGILKLKEPDTSKEIEVDAVAPDDDKDNHWLKFRYSSDGILAIPQMSPKNWSIGGNNVRFKKLERYPATATMLELMESAPKTAKRTFYDYQLMRANPRNWIYMIVKPVHTVECLCNGQPNKVVFKKPKLDDGVDWYGVNALPTHSMDHVRVFGQPWHGLQDMSGVLTMPSGNTKAGFRPGHYFDVDSVSPSKASNYGKPALYGRFLKIGYVEFPVDAVPVRDDSETEAELEVDAVFKNYAYLNGPYMQMSPMDDSEFRKRSTFAPGSWLYKCEDGAVWQLYPRVMHGHWADNNRQYAPLMELRARNLNRQLNSDTWDYGEIVYSTGSRVGEPSSPYLQIDMSTPFDLPTSFSKDGKVAHIPSSAGFWVNENGYGGTYYGAASFFCEVSGGGLDSPPTVVCEYADGSPAMLGAFDLDTHVMGARSIGGNAPVYLGGFVTPDGVKKKVVARNEFTETPEPQVVWIRVFGGADYIDTTACSVKKWKVIVEVNDDQFYTSELTQAYSYAPSGDDGKVTLSSMTESFTSSMDNRWVHGTYEFSLHPQGILEFTSSETGLSTIGSVTSVTTSNPKKHIVSLDGLVAMSEVEVAGLAPTDYVGFDPRVKEFLINKWPW